MKIIRKILFLFVLIMVVFNITAQEFYKSINQISSEANSLNYKLSGGQYYSHTFLRGSVYLSDDWSEGSIILENGDRYDNVSLKLNVFTEELVWFNKRTGALTNLDKFIIDEFILDSEKSVSSLFRKIYYDKYPKGEHYYNVLYDGKIKLLLWYRTSEVNTAIYRDWAGYLRDREYKLEKNYFFVSPNNDIIKIKGSKKSFVNLFPDRKRTVRQLFRKNKIDLLDKSESEMIRGVNLIESEILQK